MTRSTSGPVVEAEDPRISRIEEELARLRQQSDAKQAAEERLRQSQNYAGSWSGKPLSAWQQEKSRQDNLRTLAQREAVEQAEAARQARIKANAPKIAELTSVVEQARAGWETACEAVAHAEAEANRRHSELLAVRNQLGRLEAGVEGEK